jgi:hypothetical protein
MRGPLDLVADALLFLWREGILLADVHGGNLGRAARPGAPRAVVITDPGHMIEVTPEASERYHDMPGLPEGELHASDWREYEVAR